MTTKTKPQPHSIDNITGIYAGKLKRARIGDDSKRRIVISANVLHEMLDMSMSKIDFHRLIMQSALREDIDYHYVQYDLLLTIAGLQGLLAMINTQKTWEMYHSMTDLIHNNFRG